VAATFISYRRDDSAGYAGRLHEELELRLGRDRVFRDVESLPVGEDFVEAIDRRLQQCDALVAVIGRDWLSARTSAGALRLEQPDDFVALEIAAALKRPGVLVIPVLVGGAAMPSASQLPEKIRALARRHAFVLREETWESDIDRLAAVLSRGKRGTLPSRRLALAGVVLVLAAAGALLLRGRAAPSSRVAPAPAPASATEPAAPAHPTAAYAVDIPALAEAAHGPLIYSLISGSAAPRGGGASGVRLRFRVSNEGPYDANLWDASFRLAVGDDVLEPTSGLNEILPGRSIRQAVVSFVVPRPAPHAVLKVLGSGPAADIPLDLSFTGRAVEPEDADAGDALSRARLAWVMRDPRPLIAANDMSVTLVGVSSRLFVNTLRIRAAVRFANDGRYDALPSALTMRLAAGGEVRAPTSAPQDIIEAGSTFSADYVFEVPPASKNIELRASLGNQNVTVPLEVR
jgi:hypothetical protein